MMHLGRNNHKYEYVIASSGTNTTMGETTNERDLGVQVDPELKFNQHVELIANKANKMLGLIRRSFTFLDGPTVKKLYSSLVRPILEYSFKAKLDKLWCAYIFDQSYNFSPMCTNYSKDQLKGY